MNLLVVSPDFPPLGSPQAYQSARLVKALALRGYDVTVVAAPIKADAKKVFQHANEPYGRMPSSVTVRRFEQGEFPRTTLSQRIYRFFMPSDPHYQYLALRRCLRGVASEINVDAIISIAEPLVSHLAVQNTIFSDSVRFRCFWFSDPVPLSSDVAAMKIKWRRKRCEAICRKALQVGDCIVGVTAEILAPLKLLDPLSRADYVVLPHVYDPDDWPRPTIDTCERASQKTVVRITHSGALYWKRNPFVLIEGIRLLKQKRPNLCLQLVLQGGVTDEIAAELSLVAPPCPIQIEGARSYTESKTILGSSDVLCIIDVGLPRNIHLPSKIADYVGARKPILYIGREDAPVARALAEHPAFAQAHTAAEVAKALEYLVLRVAAVRLSEYEAICAKFDLTIAYTEFAKKINKCYEPSC